MKPSKTFILFTILSVFLIIFSSCEKIGSPEQKDDPGNSEEYETDSLTLKEELFNNIHLSREIPAEFNVIDEYEPTGSYEGIKAVSFMADDTTKVFAYYAVPEDMDENTPAVILVHGGLGHAYLPWVKQWLDNGYAVIAPDVTGYFPTEVNAGDTENSPAWERALNGVFAEDGISILPDNDGFENSSAGLNDQWAYKVMLALTKAYSIVSDNGSREKVGMVGISWGAVLSTIYAEYDERLSFLIPIYGSGCLSESLSYMGPIFSEPAAKELWAYDADLGNIKCPVYWLCSNYDENFSVNSNSDSFLLTKDIPGTRLAIIENFTHCHTAAWERKEPLMFADAVISGEDDLPAFVTSPTSQSTECKVQNAAKARLFYLTGELEYATREGDTSGIKYPTEEWTRATVELDGDNITGEIPDGASYYYIVISGNRFTVTSPVIKVER